MARGFKPEVVAEGVETEEQPEFLHKRQCDVIEVYPIAHHRPVGKFAALLKERSTQPAKGESECCGPTVVVRRMPFQRSSGGIAKYILL